MRRQKNEAEAPIESLVIREGHSVQTRRIHVERIVRDLYARFCSLSCVRDALRMQSHVEVRERLGTYACPPNRVDILHNVRLCVTPSDFFKIFQDFMPRCLLASNHMTLAGLWRVVHCDWLIDARLAPVILKVQLRKERSRQGTIIPRAPELCLKMPQYIETCVYQ